jgi:hypothetical protein
MLIEVSRPYRQGIARKKGRVQEGNPPFLPYSA